MSYEINVLVNGNRCKQYLHNGRTFIEAKEGSEYVVEIKNNSWEKVLAVVSVDGLNVVNGKAADENGAGYVLDRYTAQKLYGFQYSSEKVATFKFGALGAKDASGNPLGYAASKQDGSEKNTGVIGIRIWDEVPKPPAPPPPEPVYSSTTYSWTTASYSVSACSTSASYSPNPANWNTSGLYGSGRLGYGGCVSNVSTGQLLKEAIAEAKAVRQTAMANAKSAIDFVNNTAQVTYCASPDMATDEASFDMETQWGQSRSYKVKETEFERQSVIHRFDIYYTSRESLIAMGVDLRTEKRVSFPESFKENKYAKPPKGWKA